MRDREAGDTPRKYKSAADAAVNDAAIVLCNLLVALCNQMDSDNPRAAALVSMESVVMEDLRAAHGHEFVPLPSNFDTQAIEVALGCSRDQRDNVRRHLVSNYDQLGLPTRTLCKTLLEVKRLEECAAIVAEGFTVTEH